LRTENNLLQVEKTTVEMENSEENVTDENSLQFEDGNTYNNDVDENQIPSQKEY